MEVLLHDNFHSHLPSTKSPIELIDEFCCLLIKYNWGYFPWRVQLSSIHLCFQKLMLDPIPTLHFKLSVKHSLWCCWKILFKSCHHWEVKFLLPPQINSFHPPYLEIKILDQGWSWLLASCHPHLPSKAALNFFFWKAKDNLYINHNRTQQHQKYYWWFT